MHLWLWVELLQKMGHNGEVDDKNLQVPRSLQNLLLFGAYPEANKMDGPMIHR